MDWELAYRIVTEINIENWGAGQAVVGPRIAQIRAAHEVRQLADDVAREAYLAQPAAPGRRHNNPPELIDENLPEHPPETIIWVAACELRTQASAPSPDEGRIRKAVGILIGLLASAGRWTWQKVDKAVDAAADAFGKAFGAAGGAAALAYVAGYGDKIAQLVDAALRWRALLWFKSVAAPKPPPSCQGLACGVTRALRVLPLGPGVALKRRCGPRSALHLIRELCP